MKKCDMKAIEVEALVYMTPERPATEHPCEPQQPYERSSATLLKSAMRLLRRISAALGSGRTSASIALLSTALIAVVTHSEVAGAGTPATSVRHLDILNWIADGERGLWIQMGERKWFYARFPRSCDGLNSTQSLIFDTRISGNRDRTSSVVVPGHGLCSWEALRPSRGPPKSRYAAVVLQPQAQ